MKVILSGNEKLVLWGTPIWAFLSWTVYWGFFRPDVTGLFFIEIGILPTILFLGGFLYGLKTREIDEV